MNNFVINKNKGYAKFNEDNENCYIGQMVNGLRHGKGTLYYKNEGDKYEGDLVNDKRVEFPMFLFIGFDFSIGADVVNNSNIANS